MHVMTENGASGTVLNSQTQQPVVGAKVALSSIGNRFYPIPTNSPDYNGHRYKMVPPTVDEALAHLELRTNTTDIHGHFSIPPRKEWILYMPPMDIFIRSGTVVAQCEGY